MASLQNCTKLINKNQICRFLPNKICSSSYYNSTPKPDTIPQSVNKDNYDNLSLYRRGKGGRMSFNGTVTTVFGASGFMGRYIVNRLGRIGTQVICPYRSEPYYLRDLKIMGDLGQILFLPFDLRDEKSIRDSVKYSDVVVNLIGRDWETKNFKFKDVHVDGAETLARISKEAGVKRFIHVSHLLAKKNMQKILSKKPSPFLISKYEGENRVREAFPGATILRPSDVFGAEDRFCRYYAHMFRRSCVWYMQLWKRGEQTIKRPVYYRDLAAAISNAVMDPTTAGKVYDLVGPYGYKLSEILEYFYRIMRYKTFIRVPITPLFMMKVKLLGLSPSYPILNIDKIEREFHNDVLSGEMGLTHLGVTPTSLESRAMFEMYTFKRGLDYEESVGEFEIPTPPARVED